jgi:hypothetical protein
MSSARNRGIQTRENIRSSALELAVLSFAEACRNKTCYDLECFEPGEFGVEGAQPVVNVAAAEKSISTGGSMRSEPLPIRDT